MKTNRVIGTVVPTGLALAFSVPLFLAGCGPKAEKVIQQVDPDIPLLKAKAERGDAKAQNELGELFLTGKLGVATNHAEAVNWFRKAADQGHAPAQHRLGAALYLGRR